MIYLFYERDKKTAKAHQVATYNSDTQVWDGDRVQMIQRTLSRATVLGQPVGWKSDPDQLLKVFSGSRLWAVSSNGVQVKHGAVKHLRGTPNDHDQSSHAGSRGAKGPTKTEYAAWEKLSVKERFAKWTAMDEVGKDKFNRPGTSIQAELDSRLAEFGEWSVGGWQKTLKARLKQYGDFIPEDSKILVLDRMLQAEVIFRNAGASPEQTRVLLQGMTDALVVQENEALGRQLGDHGIRHLLGDEVMAQEILALHPAVDTPQIRAALVLAAVYHDTGYLAPAGRLMFGEDHPRTSTVHYNANLKPQIQAALGSEVATKVSEMIATHDSPEIDWSKPGVTSLRIADNLALFHKEKLPGLFKYVPENIDVLTRLGSGKISVEAAKVEMRNHISNANLATRVREQLYKAADEINPKTAKTTIGRLNGEISKFEWIDKGPGHLRVEMVEGTEIPPEVFAQLDMGRRQFDKFAEAYGVSPGDLWDDYQFRITRGDTILLEGEIARALKAMLKGLIIPVIRLGKRVIIPVVKHLQGQHDQSTHGNWARGAKLPKVPEAILKFESDFVKPYSQGLLYLQFENGCAVDKNGKVVWQGTSGHHDGIDMPPGVLHSIKDGVFSHNHPQITARLNSSRTGIRMEFDHSGKMDSQPPSPTDVVTAVKNDLQEIRAVGRRDNKPVVYRIIRPSNGKWPDIIKYYNDNVNQIKAEARRLHPGLEKNPNIASQSIVILDMLWEGAAKDLGIIYRVEEWIDE